MNTLDILLGLQWGDEGKGKVVDALTPNYDIVARFQGGPNAGHTIKFEGKKFVLHNIPSGVLTPGCINVIGNGVIIDPFILKGEIEGLSEAGFDLRQTLKIANRAHLILPTHRAMDAANEKALGKMKVGTTLKGIGPTYTDKTARKGLRIGDIGLADFREKYNRLKESHLLQIKNLNFDMDELRLDGMTFADYEQAWFEGVEYLKQYEFIDSEYYINEALDAGKKVLAEGAQGSMLDVDFGSYPFVTSSNVIAAGVCSGLGVAPNRIGKVFGIFKAYCTRVGTGPFPTELFDETGETNASPERKRVWCHHWPSAPLRLARPARAEICRHAQRRHRPDDDEIRRDERFRDFESRHGLPPQRSGNQTLAVCSLYRNDGTRLHRTFWVAAENRRQDSAEIGKLHPFH